MQLKFDKKCVENRVPLETMEQHLYTFLNQKYGLKPLILEWATAIITAVKRYQAVDNDVAVFGKILRNEIEERFRRVQTQLKVRLLSMDTCCPVGIFVLCVLLS